MKNITLICVFILCHMPLASAQTPRCDNTALSQDMKPSFHTVNGMKILMLAGGIVSDSYKVVSPYIRNTRSYKEVWLCSGGGYVRIGIAIGQALNRVKATVRTPNHFVCASACTIASMGGYARIIDPNAQFVTHASSGASSFGYEMVKKSGEVGIKFTRFGSYDCKLNSWTASYCKNLRLFFKNAKLSNSARCANPEDVDRVNTKCIYFDTQGKNYRDNVIITNSKLTALLSVSDSLTKQAIGIEMKSSVEGETKLLEYFQTMLLDGKTSYVKHYAYNQIKANFTPQNIYDLPETETYSRNLSDDIKSMYNARDNLDQLFAIWQVVLTDSELSLKTQISEYIRNNNINLGVANEDALKMYDAMRTCQIQSSCRLEGHTARALGYHNMYGNE